VQLQRQKKDFSGIYKKPAHKQATRKSGFGALLTGPVRSGEVQPGGNFNNGNPGI